MLSCVCAIGLSLLCVAPCPCAPDGDTPVVPASHLINQTVRTCLGEPVGLMTDVILAPPENRAAYIIVAADLPEARRLPVPWEVIEIGPEGVIINANLSQLRQAPGLDSVDWPHLSDPEWQALVRTYYGFAPYSEAAISMTRCASVHVSLEQLKQMDVTATGLRRVGRVEDVLVDGSGQLAYTLVRLNDYCAPELVLVPSSIVHIVPQDHKIMVEATWSLMQSVCFSEANWPDLCDAGYVKNLHLRFDATPYWSIRHRSCCPDDPWQIGSRYDLLFNPKQMACIEGVIKEVGTFRRNWGEPGVRIKVLTQDGPVYTIQAGPISQAHAAGLFFCKGQYVSADGSLNRKNKLMATEIRAGTVRWRIRDDNGCLLW